MHHKNEVAKIMNDLVKGQGLDIGPEIKRVHELMDAYKKLPTGDDLHKTMRGRSVLLAISFPIANDFNTHPEKVTGTVEQIIDNLNRI